MTAPPALHGWTPPDHGWTINEDGWIVSPKGDQYRGDMVRRARQRPSESALYRSVDVPGEPPLDLYPPLRSAITTITRAQSNGHVTTDSGLFVPAPASRRRADNNGHGAADQEAPPSVARRPGGQRDFRPWLETRTLPPRPVPTLFTRTDEQPLLYEGKVNGLFGAKESAKSWIAAAAMQDALDVGKKCAWIDLDYMEDEPGERLILLGTPWEVVADEDRLRVYSPADLREYVVAMAACIEWGVEFSVADALGDLLAMTGADSNSADHFATAFRTYISPLQRGGRGTVLTVDHTGKGASVSYGPAGTEGKGRPIRGAFLGVVPTGDRPSPGHSGAVDLVLAKDTYGALRTNWEDMDAGMLQGLPRVARFELTYEGPERDSHGSLSWALLPPPSVKETMAVSVPPSSKGGEGGGGGTLEVTDSDAVDAVERAARDLAAYVATNPGSPLLGQDMAVRSRALSLGLIREQRCGSDCPVCPPDGEMRGRHKRTHFFPAVPAEGKK